MHETTVDQAPEQASAQDARPDVDADQARDWSVADAADLYGIERWGNGYFSVNQRGHVAVQPQQDPQQQVDLYKLVQALRQRDVKPPLLIRFTDILAHRLGQIARAFEQAIREHDYQGQYRCVYPIKVNQQRHVVEEIQTFGREHGFGLEAGSKPELLAIMALVQDEHTPIICNGFKDGQFIEAVMLATKMGRNVIPVVEKFSELELIARYAKIHDVRPRIGIRVKLAARGAGQWESSGGERSKFGLFISEVLQAVSFLRQEQMLDCLKLLHFHVGSQVNDIRNIKNALTELVRVYVELHRAGAGLEYIDVGGGLGVDYDGSKTSQGSSMNYSLQEYANDVVYHVREMCQAANVPHPTIISESGRAMVAYHSVLVFNIVGWSGFDRFELPGPMDSEQLRALPQPVQTLVHSFNEIDAENFVEYYHDAQMARDEVVHLFNLGYCSLEHRGLAERLYFGVCSKVLRFIQALPHVPEEFQGLEAGLADTYFCNYSIFQSMPDSWAIDQVFPIMPIHRLNERPCCRGLLGDITCDSDGRIDRFIGKPQSKPVLELHPFDGQDYFVAAFLVGAYQEILGDLHNLFGDTNAVHVSVDEQGKPSIDEIVEGDSVSEVLQYVQYNPHELRRRFRQAIERAVQCERLTLDEARTLRRFYEGGLQGYTYLT